MYSFRAHSDASIVRRVLRGHRDEFGVLVTRYIRLAESVAFAQLGSASEAEEMAQEGFVRAFERLDMLEDPGKFSAWLLTIVRNLCLDFHRSRLRRREIVDNLYPLPLPEAPSVERRELHGILRGQVETLETSHREVLLMHYFAQVSVKDIASLLAISPEAVRKRLQRARDVLGEQMLLQIEPTPETRRGDTRRIARIMAVIAAIPVAWEAAGVVQAAMLLSPDLFRGAVAVMLLLLAGGGMVWLKSAGPEPRAPSLEPASAPRAAPEPAEPDVPPGTDKSTAAASPAPVPSASFEGSLRDTRHGAPIAGATIGYTTRTAADTGHPVWESLETDADGHFRSGELAPGNYVVRVADALGFAAANLGGETQIKVMEQGATQVHLTLDHGMSIEGRVVDSAGLPVEGARVDAAYADLARPPNAVKTLADGSFVLYGYAAADKVYLQARKRDAITPPFGPVQPGERDVLLALAPAITLAGRAVDNAGQPLPGVPLQAWPVINSLFVNQDLVLTASDGSFSLEGLWAGEYTLLVPELANQPRLRVIAPESVTASANAPASPVMVVIEPVNGLTIAGRILDLTGKIVAGAEVVAVPADGETRKTVSSNQGVFRLESLPPGAHPVTVRAAGYFKHAETLEAGSREAVLRLIPFDSVPVRVVDAATGAPVPAFGIGVCAGHIEHAWEAPVDTMISVEEPQGRYEARLKSEESNTIFAWAGGYALEAQGVEYVDRRPTPSPVVLRLRPEMAASGRIVDVTGAPVGDVRIYAGEIPPFEQHAPPRAVSDGNGRFEVAHLDKDTPFLSFVAAGLGPAWLNTARIRDWRNVEVVMEEPAGLRGVVHAAEDGLSLFVYYDELGAKHGVSARLEPNAAFELKGLAPRPATLLLGHDSDSGHAEEVIGAVDLAPGHITEVALETNPPGVQILSIE